MKIDNKIFSYVDKSIYDKLEVTKNNTNITKSNIIELSLIILFNKYTDKDIIRLHKALLINK